MRIVATSDTHYPPFTKRFDTLMNPVYYPTLTIPNGDVFIHAGDLMRTGYPDEWGPAVEWLARLPHKIKLFVPGNHDFHLQVYPGPALQQLRQAGVTVVGLPGNKNYYSVILPNGMSLLGLPYVVDLERWVFSVTEEQLVAALNEVWIGEHDIIVSHAPVYGILDGPDKLGVKVYREALEAKLAPKVWISGHVHEGYGAREYNGCTFYNVSMCDRNYNHVHRPFVIDV